MIEMENNLIEKLESEFPQTQTNSFQMVDVKALQYSSCLPEVMKSVKYGVAKVCVISISRQGEKVLNELKKNKVNPKNLLVVSGIKESSPLANVRVFQPQWDINALKNSISFAVKNFGADIFVFDSVTALTLFLTKEEIVGFFQKFVGILKSRHMKGVFINILEETPDDIAVRVEGLMDQRLSLEKFIGSKTKVQQIKKPVTSVVKAPTQKQALDVKSLKKSISQLIKEEAKKISEETKKNLRVEKPPFKKRQVAKTNEKKHEVHKLEKEKEKLSLQKKLELLQKSFELGVISQKAFEEGKRQIKAKMSKI